MPTVTMPTNKPTGPAQRSVPVINAAPDTHVQAGPGEHVVWLRDEELQTKFGVFAWQRLGDGTYSPCVRIYDTLVRLSEVQKIGIRIPWDTLRRLCNAGFVTYTQPAPGTIFVHVDSLVEHLEAARDPEFWTDKRRAQYSAGIR